MRIALLLLLVLFASLLAGEHTEFVVQKAEPFQYCAVEMVGNFMQHEEGFMTLYEQAGLQGITADAQMPLGVYYDNPMQTPEDELKWDVGFKLNEKVDVKDPLVVKSWDVTLQAETVYSGAMNDELGVAQGELFGWVLENGYQITGPMMLIYLDTGSEQEGVQVGKVKIIIPVSK